MSDAIRAELAEWSDRAAVVAIGPSGTWTFGPVEDPAPLASVTKVIVAMACWVALEEGSLRLADPAGPRGSTVEHLLAHASGLPFEGDQPIAPPGTRRIYSNTGFDTLADHLVRVTSISWQDYVTDAVIAPLGMSATTLIGPASAGGVGSAADLAKLAQELRAPTLVSRSTVVEATSDRLGPLDGVVPGFGTFRPCPWGLGVELRGEKSPHWTPPDASPETFGHFGGSGTFLWVDPSIGVAAVGLGHRDFGPWAVELWPRLGQLLIDLGR